MADFETDLINYLSNESTLTALVAKKIYFNNIPQNIKNPAIRVQTISTDEKSHSIPGNYGLIAENIQFDVYANTKASAVEIREVLRDLLINHNDSTFGDYDLQRCRIANRDNDNDENEFHEMLEFEFIYSEN